VSAFAASACHHGSQTRRAAWLVVILIYPLASMAEFKCAALRPSASRSPPYGPIANQTRCEGFFEKTVSQPFLELVSLTRGTPQLQGAQSTKITAKGASRLVVHPLRDVPLYRVDVNLENASEFEFAPKGMLDATGLATNELGFLAYVETPSGDMRRFAPVALSSQASTSAIGTMVIRPSVDIGSIAWRSYPKGSGSDSEWTRIAGNVFYAWRLVTAEIRLSEDAPHQFDVRATDPSGRALPLLSFVVVASPKQ
jgi:hypothetical protein